MTQATHNQQKPRPRETYMAGNSQDAFNVVKHAGKDSIAGPLYGANTLPKCVMDQAVQSH